MVDPEENRTATIIREFGEEALNSLEATDEQKLEINKVMKDFFIKGTNVSKLYIYNIYVYIETIDWQSI